MGRLADQVACRTRTSDRKVVPSVHIRCGIALMRRARATMARFVPRRHATFTAHGLSHVERPRCIMTVAAWHSARRRVTSPAMVIPPEMPRSPAWLRDGARPTHGPTFCDDGEPRGIIDFGAIGQPHARAHTRHRHQSVADRVVLRQLTGPASQSCKLLPLGCPRPQHRVVCRQLFDAVLEPAAGDRADVPQQSTR